MIDSALTGANLSQSGLTQIMNFIESYEANATSGLLNVADILATDGGLRYDASTGNFYKFASGTHDYNAALSGASSYQIAGLNVNGHLLTVESEAEETFIETEYSGNTSIWVAASDATTDGTFVWDAGPNTGESITIEPFMDGFTQATGTEGAAIDTNNGGWITHATSTHLSYVIEIEGDEVFGSIYESISNVSFANILLEEINLGNVSEATGLKMLDLIQTDGLHPAVAGDMLQNTSTNDFSYVNLNNFINHIIVGNITAGAAVGIMNKVQAGEIELETFRLLIEYVDSNPSMGNIFDSVNNFIDTSGNTALSGEVISSLFSIDPAASTLPQIDADTLKGLIDIMNNSSTVDSFEMHDVANMLQSGEIDGDTLERLVDFVQTTNITDLQAANIIDGLSTGNITADTANHLIDLLHTAAIDSAGFVEYSNFINNGNPVGNALVEAVHSGTIATQTGFVLKDSLADTGLVDSDVKFLLDLVKAGTISTSAIDTLAGMMEADVSAAFDDAAHFAIKNVIKDGFTSDFFNDLMNVSTFGTLEENLVIKMLESFETGETLPIHNESILDLVQSNAGLVNIADVLLDIYIAQPNADHPMPIRLSQSILENLSSGNAMAIVDIQNMLSAINSGQMQLKTGVKILQKVSDGIMPISDANTHINSAGSTGASSIDNSVGPMHGPDSGFDASLDPFLSGSEKIQLLDKINDLGEVSKQDVQDLLSSSLDTGAISDILRGLANIDINPAVFQEIMDLSVRSAQIAPPTLSKLVGEATLGNINFADTYTLMDYINDGQMSNNELAKLLDGVQSGNLTNPETMKVAHHISQNTLTDAENTALLNEIQIGNISDFAGAHVFKATVSGLDFNAAEELIVQTDATNISESELQLISQSISDGHIDAASVNTLMTQVDSALISGQDAVQLLGNVSNGNLLSHDFDSFVTSIGTGNISSLGVEHFIDALSAAKITPVDAHDFMTHIADGTLSAASFELMFDLIDGQNLLDAETALTMLDEVEDGNIFTADADTMMSQLSGGQLHQDSFELAVDGVEEGFIDQTEINDLVNNLDTTVDNALQTLANGNDIDDTTFNGWTASQQNVVSDFMEINDNLTDALPDPDGNLFALDVPQENEDGLTGINGL